MVPYELYDVALAFKKAALWKRLSDTQLFAVKFSDGETGYCCVMGMLGEHHALAVYVGGAGLDSYRRMFHETRDMDVFERHELSMSQDCAMVSYQLKSALVQWELDEIEAYTAARGLKLRGKNAYPKFERFRPHMFPWKLSDARDQMYLSEALAAAMEVAERLRTARPEQLGFVEGAQAGWTIPMLERSGDSFSWSGLELPEMRELEFASPRIHDELALARIKRNRERSGVWSLSILMHIRAASDAAEPGDYVEYPEDAPYFPYLLMIVDEDTGMLLDMELFRDFSEADQLCEAFVNYVQEAGRPVQLLVMDDRTQAFFRYIAPQLGVELARRDELPALEAARQGMAESFAPSQQGGSEQDLLEMLSDPEVYPDIPDDLLRMLRDGARNGALPPDIADMVERECRRRGM